MKNNATKLVSKFIDRNQTIKRNLYDGLIKQSTLAKHIIKNVDPILSLEAVTTSIRRYMEKEDYQQNVKDFNGIIKNSRLFSKNKLVSMLINKSDATLVLLSDVFNLINFHNGETIRLVKGAANLELIFDEKNLEKIKKIFSESQILNVKKEIAEITLFLGKGVETTPGVYATILNELALNSINLHDAVTCASEYLIYVDEKDFSKAYQVLYNLCNENIFNLIYVE